MFTVTASVLPLCSQETIDFSLGLYLDQEVKEFSGSSSLSHAVYRVDPNATHGSVTTLNIILLQLSASKEPTLLLDFVLYIVVCLLLLS